MLLQSTYSPEALLTGTGMAIIDVSIEKESSDRYLTYALSVVSGRALPDVRDGLKPVQRRILYAMLDDLKLAPDQSYKKSATVVGAVLGKYHPHGDIACYEAMVRMAQDFSLRYPLVDGQGNFGSLDGDSAAAYRYTEVKLRAMAMEAIGEIYEETVEFRENFDASTKEPTVFPSRIPNLLINGAAGIAVGMATSIPPHNLKDVLQALIELSKDPELSVGKLTTIIKAPDFPTGCLILNTRKEIEEMYRTGRGAVRMRGEWSIEEGSRGKRSIIVSSIPYAINKAQLVEKIADLIVERKVPQLVDVRDESTADVRIVIELATDANADAAMAYLFKHTTLETSFAVNLTALTPTENGGLRPELLSLKQCLQHFISFRELVVQRRLEFEKRTLEARIHILEGLVKIFDSLDEAIKIVRKSDGRSDAAGKLEVRFKLTEIQALAVVDMRIYQLSRTNIDEIREELKERLKRIGEIDTILKSKTKLSDLVRREFVDLQERFGDKRRSKIAKDDVELEYSEEAYVVHEDVYAVVTVDGWLKRIRQTNEVSATRLREGDRILDTHAVSTKDFVAFFTSFGNLYILRVAEIPASSGYGDPIQKIFKFKDGESIVRSFPILFADPNAAKQTSLPGAGAAAQLKQGEALKQGDSVVVVTKQGVGFGLQLTDLSATKKTGRRAVKIREGDALAAVTSLDKKLALFTEGASGLVINGSDIPVRDAAAVGVSLMGVRDDDRLVAAIGYSGNVTFKVSTDGGKVKEVPSKEITSGHRALKGTKVIARGSIEKVEKAS